MKRTIATAPNDPAVIAGYSVEMLDAGISSISNTPNAGPWEKERLRMLKAERSGRGVAVVTTAHRPLDLRASDSGAAPSVFAGKGNR